ncbi:hypothetical protein F441_02117 [Phytophthora nicotianae CJ01A1]|uniref:Uncharacterized protein n=1 Tax=Phytophthora nicotianae CJ01A1 TaxID=1317063 RepID=W2XSQ7_PHYNI|nr:hypothetical protein F441_02117 [Phytophthora nicotianae CJ01A1]
MSRVTTGGWTKLMKMDEIRPETTIPSRPDCPTQTALLPTSPHVMDNESPASSPSSSASPPPQMRTAGGVETETPSPLCRNLDAELEAADSSCSEYMVSDSEAIENRGPVAVVADEETQEDPPDMFADPSIALASENQNDYMRLESDDDTEDASVFSGDGDLDSSEVVYESDGIAPDLHFDPELLNATSGVTAISRSNVDKTLLSDMKFNGWTDPSNVTPYPYIDEPYEARPDSWMLEDYSGIYDGNYGPTPGALNAAETPAGAFFRLAPPHVGNDCWSN